MKEHVLATLPLKGHHHTVIAEPKLLGDSRNKGQYAQALPQHLAVLEREEVGLIDAPTALRKDDEVSALKNEIEPPLKASPSPYAVKLQQRLTAG